MTTTFVRQGLSPDAIHRRAGARRRYNAEQTRKAQARRDEILAVNDFQLLFFTRGIQARLAACFGVNRSTICRDIQAIIAKWRADGVCTKCGERIANFSPKTIEILRETGTIRQAMRMSCTPRKCAAAYRLYLNVLDELDEPIGEAAQPGRSTHTAICV